MNGDGQSLHLDKRKAVLGVILALLLAGAAFTVLGQVAQLGRIGSALRRADKWWLPLCIGGQLLGYLGYISAYHDTARASGGPRFSFKTTAQIIIFGDGTAILGASVAGLAVAYWALRRSGTKPHTASRRALALGTIEWSVLSLYGWIAALLVLVLGLKAPLAMTLPWLIVIPLFVAIALWLTSPRRVRRFIDAAPLDTAADGRLPRAIAWVREKAHEGFADALAGIVLIRHLFSHPLRYRLGAIGYPIYWAADMLILYAALRAFGVHPSILPMVLGYATSNVLTLMPLPAGGAGGIDAGIVLSLRAVGLPLAPTLLAVLVYRIVTFWLPTIPSLLLLPTMRRLHEALPSVGHTHPDGDEGVSFRPAVARAGHEQVA